ncbi:MAG: metalloregulator ArsR/SmtB family transcription factor [Planctomycetota bacterium]
MMELASTSRLLKALADETRLRILNLLGREELTGTDLMEILNMGQSRISTHLTLLKEVGLVRDRRAGRRVYYTVVQNGSASDLLSQVLEENSGSTEFASDVASLEDLQHRQHTNESRSFFDRVAATFGDQVLPGRTWEGLCRALLRLAPRVRYADLGIGDGLLTMMVAEVAESVTAVDISPKMLDLLRQRAKTKGLSNIETVEGEIEALPLEDGIVDVAILSQALHHAVEPSVCLAEAARILVPGGRLLVIDLHTHTEDWVREKLQHRHLGFSESALSSLLQEAGFESVHVQRAARDPHPPHFLTLVATGTKAR